MPMLWAMYLFIVLFVLSLFYQLQAYLPYIFGAATRAAIFGIVIAVISYSWATVKLDDKHLRLLVCWFILVALVSLHTCFLHGLEFTLAASMRFVNVMILMPLTFFLTRGGMPIKSIFVIFTGAALLAFASVGAQLQDYEFPTLTGDYIAIRGDLVRHMSIFGEPNVGGMAAVMAYCYALICVKRHIVAVTLMSFFICGVILSLSKAALFGIPIVASLSILFSVRGFKGECKSYVGPIAARVFFGLLGGVAIVLALGGGAYIAVAFDVVVGNIGREPGLLEDFFNRQNLWNLSPDLIFGRSFSSAGSVAYAYFGNRSVLPHNSYVELLLVGGVILLAGFLIVSCLAAISIFQRWLINRDRFDAFALVGLLISFLWMFTYPVIYEPVTGAVWWVLVGYGLGLRKCPQQELTPAPKLSTSCSV